MSDYIDFHSVDRLIGIALDEDVGAGDVTTLATVPTDLLIRGEFVVRQAGVVAGLAVVPRVFARLDQRVDVQWRTADGETVGPGNRIGTVSGPARALLTGERVALNLLQRMSGVATASRKLVEAARPTTVLDTRKTAPGLRLLDKWAVRLGGAQNHRFGLYDRFLIKNNHITAAGGIAPAIEAAASYRKEKAPGLLIQIEARTLEEVGEIVEHGGVDWVLLDNMVRMHDDGLIDVALLKAAVARIGGRFRTEASGNVTVETARAIAATGVDYLSSGALTHSVRALDISLHLGAE